MWTSRPDKTHKDLEKHLVPLTYFGFCSDIDSTLHSLSVHLSFLLLNHHELYTNDKIRAIFHYLLAGLASPATVQNLANPLHLGGNCHFRMILMDITISNMDGVQKHCTFGLGPVHRIAFCPSERMNFLLYNLSNYASSDPDIP